MQTILGSLVYHMASQKMTPKGLVFSFLFFSKNADLDVVRVALQEAVVDGSRA